MLHCVVLCNITSGNVLLHFVTFRYVILHHVMLCSALIVSVVLCYVFPDVMSCCVVLLHCVV